jgi:exopolyphosphatase/guanosine-5'-triphosphate,3'-diphosphate pyrophosphatase
MIRASIDLGTNTCLLLLARCDSAGQVAEVLEDHSTVVRLGQGVDKNKSLHPDAIRRTLDCLRRYSEQAKAAGADPAKAICVATSQARDSANGAEFFARVKNETGFRFQVISGDMEAKLTFLGALLPGMNPAEYAVIDIGGGSTEFMSTDGGLSLDIGSVRFTERYLKSDPVTDAEFWACQSGIDAELAKLADWRKTAGKGRKLLAVAGTATTLAAWFLELPKFDARKIDEVTLTRGDVHRQVEELKWRSVAERQALTGIEQGRADVLLAGALILWRAMEVLGFDSIRVSTRGLRYGAVTQLQPA